MTDDVRLRLADVGQRRAAAWRDLEDARRRLVELRPELERAVLEARAAGVPVVEIARLARISRQEVYRII